MERKDFKIIKILNEYDVIINGGSNYKIVKGDEFEIYKQGDPIIDPDTDEMLGQVDLTKGKIVAKEIYEKISLCTSFTEYSFLNSFPNLAESLLKSEKGALNIDYNEISDGYSEEEKKIRIGDLVRKIVSKSKDNVILQAQESSSEKYDLDNSQ